MINKILILIIIVQLLLIYLLKSKKENFESKLDCVIVIPYRNREKHLNYYIKNTVPILKKHLPNSKVVIVEQANNKEFNRGKILNVGFNEYKNKTNYFITQDVDINPKQNVVTDYFAPPLKKKEVRSILGSPSDTLGGIIKISSNNIFKINGFPNNFWGWGVEDKALQNRSNYLKLDKQRNFIYYKDNPNKNFIIFNDKNDRVLTKNSDKKRLLHFRDYDKLSEKQKFKDIYSSGLNNLDYKILERKHINDYIEIIKVDI